MRGGQAETVPWLRAFYFGSAEQGTGGSAEQGTGGSAEQGTNGNGKPGLRSLVSDERITEIDPREVNTIPLGDDENGQPIVIRVRWGGAVVQRGDEMAAVPEGTAPDEITVQRAEELFESSKERNLGTDPETGLPILVKSGRFGPYVQVGELDPESKEKPKTASLLKSMRPELITYEEAMRLLSLPRLVGMIPSQGMSFRYGKYWTAWYRLSKTDGMSTLIARPSIETTHESLR